MHAVGNFIAVMVDVIEYSPEKSRIIKMAKHCIKVKRNKFGPFDL